MAVETKLNLIISAQNNADKELKKLQLQLSDTSKTGNSASESLFNFGNVLKGAGIAIATVGFLKLTSAFKDFLSTSIRTSLKVEMTAASIFTLAKNAGRTKDEVNQLIDAIRKENKSFEEALNITQGIIIADLSQSEALQLLAKSRDIAAAAGKSSKDVNEGIVESIMTMNVQMLDQFGINISLRIAYDNLATSLGKTSSELTSTERQQAIFNEVMKEGDKFAGAYNDSMETAGKQLLSLKDQTEDTKLVMGKLLTQGFEPIIHRALEAARSFSQWALTADGELNPKLQETADLIGNKLNRLFESLMKNVFQNETVIKTLSATFEILIGIWNNSLEPSLERIKQVIIENKDEFILLAKVIGGTLVASIIIAAGSIALITKYIAFMMETTEKMNKTFMDAPKNIGDSLASIVEKFVNFTASIMKELVKLLPDITNTLWGVGDAIWSAFQAAADWVLDRIRGFTDQIVDMFRIGDRIKDALGGAFSGVGDKLSGVVGRLGSMLPGRATGGPVSSNQPYMVGEQGPELFVPKGNGDIVPNNQMGGVTVNFNNASVRSDNDLRDIANIVERTLNRNLRLNQIGI